MTDLLLLVSAFLLGLVLAPYAYLAGAAWMGRRRLRYLRVGRWVIVNRRGDDRPI